MSLSLDERAVVPDITKNKYWNPVEGSVFYFLFHRPLQLR